MRISRKYLYRPGYPGEEKFGNRRSETHWCNFRRETLCGKRECWRGCKTKSVFKVYEPAQTKCCKDLLLIEILQTWTFACEAARNSGPDTLGKEKFVIEANTLVRFSQQDLVRKRDVAVVTKHGHGQCAGFDGSLW